MILNFLLLFIISDLFSRWTIPFKWRRTSEPE